MKSESVKRQRALQRKPLVVLAAALIVVALIILIVGPVFGQVGPAETVANFEIDANSTVLRGAMYSGTNTTSPGDD